MKKRFLLAPGPTPVPDRALLAMAAPIIHHRTAEFEKIVASVQEDLRYLFQTKQDVLVLAASGTGAMEAAVSNLLSPGDRAVCVRGGKFGERWSEICGAYGVEPVNIDVEWGRAVDPAVVEKTLAGEPGIKAVYVQASETSTGVRHDVEALAGLTSSRPGTVLVVDAITGVGVFDIPMDRWGIDVVVTGSQKALMLPPGLAFIALSEKAWQMAGSSTCPRFYFDLQKERKALGKNTTAYTPAVSLIIGLAESLRMIREEGLEKLFARHALLARATREAMIAIGLDLYAPDSPSDALTSVVVPEGVDGNAFKKDLASKYGVTVAGGQGKVKGRIFRIAHLGYADTFDILTAVSAVEMTLKDHGYPAEPGRGVARAQEILASG